METNKENTEQARNEQIGGLAGMGAGMLAGARVGTMLIPIPVVGTFLGGLFGGVAGTEIGKRIGPALINAGTAFLQTVTTAPQAEPKAGGEDSAAEASA
jgi:phage tail tape-measure protein